MTLKIRMLAATAAFAIPALAGAQLVPTSPPPATTQEPDSATETARATQQAVNPAAERAQGTEDEAVRQTEEAPVQPVQDPLTTAQPEPTPPVEALPTTTPPAATPPAEAPPAETQAAAQATAQTHAAVQAGPVSAATATDLRAGVMVHDTAGGMVGTVVSADADSAVVSTGAIQAEIPLRSFGKNSLGLVISMTRAQLEAAVRAQSPG